MGLVGCPASGRGKLRDLKWSSDRCIRITEFEIDLALKPAYFCTKGCIWAWLTIGTDAIFNSSHLTGSSPPEQSTNGIAGAVGLLAKSHES